MSKPIRWGILGAGNIARKFARDLAITPGASLAAVATTSPERGASFAAEFKPQRVCASYEQLADDPEVDVVYIASRNHVHAENARLMLEHGKPVLCEKPFTINAAQLRALIALARHQKLFLMEAMWTRFFPAMKRARTLLESGAIGAVKTMTADFGFLGGNDPQSRLLNPALGGGALLDVGVYVISLAYHAFGRPVAVSGQAVMTSTGVDEQFAATLQFPGGRLAMLSAAVNANTSKRAVFYGAEGSLTIEAPLWKPHTLTVQPEDKPAETLNFAYPGGGYQFEILEVMECLRLGRLECALMPLDESLAIMETMDSLRASWGFKYPME